MNIEVTDKAKEAIEIVIKAENFTSPQLIVHGQDNDRKINFELIIVNGVPHEEDLVFDYGTFKVSINQTYVSFLGEDHVIDFQEKPFTAFTFTKKENN